MDAGKEAENGTELAAGLRSLAIFICDVWTGYARECISEVRDVGSDWLLHKLPLLEICTALALAVCIRRWRPNFWQSTVVRRGGREDGGGGGKSSAAGLSCLR